MPIFDQSLDFPTAVLMIRPASFGFNQETAISNVFQQATHELSDHKIKTHALAEFDGLVTELQQHGLDVLIINDTPSPPKPDAIFPNNWLATMPNGSLYTYPMADKSRRQEVRSDVLVQLKEEYELNEVIELHEHDSALEGTGSIVFDHAHKKAYACRSSRTNEELFNEHCRSLGYESILFDATDKKGTPIYHTNVMMSIGRHFAIVCTSTLGNTTILHKLQADDLRIIDISEEQMRALCGNVFLIQGKNQDFLIMSSQAYHAFDTIQIELIEKTAIIIHAPIPTIESIGGGGVRCMMAGIHLKKKL